MRNSFIFILVLVLLVSCKSVEKVVEVNRELPNITETRLLRNIYFNELDYNTIYAKKIDLTLKEKKKSHSLKAMIRIQRDSFIWVSVTAPMGIEVARILLTPDSVKFTSPRDKKYFVSDYNYFIDRFDAGFTYDCFQRMLTNRFFDFESCTSEVDRGRRFKFDKSGNDYILYTLEEKTLGRKLKKLYKKKRKNKEFSVILQKIHIDPDCFRPLLVSIEDMDEKVGMSVKYGNIKDYEGKLFPGKIVFNIFTDEEEWEVQLDFDRLEFDVEVSPNFKISSKYKRMY